MVRIVCWNINRQRKPWERLKEMAERCEADVALLQEVGKPPGKLAQFFRYENDVFWDPSLFSPRSLVVQLSDRVEVEWFRQVPPSIGKPKADEIGVSGVGTIGAAKVIPRDRPEKAFIAISMYANWMSVHPCAPGTGRASDVSAHRILSDLSAFRRCRIVAAGDLNMFYGACGKRLSMPCRERTVWERFKALGLEFLGPQLPNGRPSAKPQPDVPAETGNVPTYYTTREKCAANARRQLDYAFASRGFHRQVKVRALNGIDEWGPSDHCRLLIEVATG
ncbi:MAG: endonuclease/exonuclease/phosphatase family protein [Alphaproteobacteria bacterium]|nr:endonuclease/exonuclease/phosphatase family protein [Alphaproteobacteria bacterium]